MKLYTGLLGRLKPPYSHRSFAITLCCRTIYQKLLLDKEGQVKVENGLPLPVIEAKDESAQNQNQDQDQYIGLKDIKRQRISQSPSADSEKIDLTLSEDPESA